jgi:hypothetical protein
LLRRSVSIILCVMLLPAWILSGTFVTAKYAGAFLAGGFGARSAAMGNAQSAAVNDASAMFWNPACLVMLDRLEIQGMHSERFSGLVDADYIGAGFPLGDKAALGAGFYRLAVDDIPVTRLLDPSLPMGQLFRDEQNRLVQNVPAVSGTLVNQEMAIFFSYGRRGSAFWNWGGGMKVLHKQAGGYSAWGLGFDAGVMLFPYGDCRVAFMLQDATTTVLAWNGKRRECILPRLRTGVCYPFRIRSIGFVPAADIESSLESPDRKTGRVSLDFHAGIEMDMLRRVSLRSGMDRNGWSVGAGMAFSRFRLDYAFVPDRELGFSQRIATSILLGAARSARTFTEK